MFENYTPQQLRDAIEIELQNTSDVKEAAYTAKKNLESDPDFYTMQKARIIKYIKREKGKNGKWIYTYPENIKRVEQTKPVKHEENKSESDNKRYTKKTIARPIADVGIKHGDKLPEGVILHGSKGNNFEFEIDSTRTFYGTTSWDIAEGYAKKSRNDIFAVKISKNAKILDMSTIEGRNRLADILYEVNGADKEEMKEDFKKTSLHVLGFSDDVDYQNALYEKNIDGIKDVDGNYDITNNDCLESFIPNNAGIAKAPEKSKHVTETINGTDMAKARIVKYIKRVPKPSGKGFYYFYNREDFAKYQKTGKVPDGQSDKPNGTITEKILKFFGLDRQAAREKIRKDFESNKISETFGITSAQWFAHVNEYFTHKEYWDSVFAHKEKKAGEKKPSSKTKGKKTHPSGGKASDKTKEIMKYIYNLYGNKSYTSLESKKETKTEEPKKKNPKDQPEKKEEGEKEEETTPEKDLSDQAYLDARLDEYVKKASVIGAEYYAQGKSSAPIHCKEVMDFMKALSKEYVDKGIAEPFGKSTPIFKAFSDAWMGAMFKSMVESADKIKDEEEKQKVNNENISKAINVATPENRNEIEKGIRELSGEKTEEAEPETPKVDFKPEMVEYYFSKHVTNDSKLRNVVYDYTAVKPIDIFLVREKDILTKERPSYIPEASEDYFSDTGFFFPTVKLEEDKYIIQLDSVERRKAIYEDTGTYRRLARWENVGKDNFVIVNRDVAAAIQDYYMKKAKALKKQDNAKRVEDGKRPDKKRLSMISENRMSYKQMYIFNAVYPMTGATSKTGWNKYREMRSDLRQKLSDMTIQLEEHYNAHAKGRETSYGDKGTKDDLLKDYGVKVKRQNGAEINDAEIGQIKSAISDVFSVFGDRSSMAKNFGLKISHSGDVGMHARKAAGIYFPSYKAIGVTAKHGDAATGFILAHEWAHFMDNYLGEKTSRHYASDNPNHVAGQIAKTFRDNMSKFQKSDYHNRTCECFARAMEQYWAIKTNNMDVLDQWNQLGTHPKDDFFKANIMPLIDKFLFENNELLKAIDLESSIRDLREFM